MTVDWVAAATYQPPRHERYEPTVWRRVSKATPCPICGKPDGCSIAEAGDVVLCMRVGSDKPVEMNHGIGHIHRLDDWRDAPRPIVRQSAAREPSIDAEAIMARWQQDTDGLMIAHLAYQLGVGVIPLMRMTPAWSEPYQAWAFPMSDARGNYIGIRLRNQTGKWAVRGSRSGLFRPATLTGDGPLLICEGPTDTAAAMTLGFDAIGRASCSGSVDMIMDVLRSRDRREVVVVADCDGPGRIGATRLAHEIIPLARSVRIITPMPHEDLREWLRNGATRERMLLRIDQAQFQVTEWER